MKDAELKKSNAIGKAVSTAVIIMAVSNITSRLLGWGRIKVLAYFAGVSGDVDAYIFAFAIPDLINHFLAGSALSITFIPLFQNYLINNDEKEGWRFFSNVFTVGTIFFIVAIAISMIFTQDILALAGKNINDPGNPKQIVLTLRLTRIILPAQLFFFWGALLNGVQYAKKRFLLPALTPVLYNLGIICGGVFLYKAIGIDGFTWGVLIGAFLGNVAIQIPGALSVGMRYRPRIDLKDKTLKTFALITVPLIIGLSMTFSNELFPKYFASFVPNGKGAISSLDYSFKIVSMLFGLFGQSVVAGVYPFLSQLAVEKKIEEMHTMLATILTKIASLLIPCIGIFMVLAPSIIAILLEGGAFNTRDTALTAKTFSSYLPSAFFMAGALLFIRAYYALQRTFFPMIISTCIISVCLPLYYFSAIKIGALGIARTATFAMALLFFTITFFWNRHYKNKHLSLMVKNVGIITVISIVGALICMGIKRWALNIYFFSQLTLLKHLLLCMVAGIPSFLVIVGGIEAAGVQNIRKTIGTYLNKSLRK